ncbi:MAG TPA: DUF4124 domain-containing protein [Desulfuromonadaceae bacterium]|jgi:hypothetical protein
MKLAVLVITSALAAAVSAEAATYRWTDRQGVIHYTDNPASIPPEYRNKLNKSEDITIRNPKIREELKEQEERARQEERLRPPVVITPEIAPIPSPPPQVAPPRASEPAGRTKSERLRENRERREGR